MELREVYQSLLAKLSEKEKSSTDPQQFCEEIVEAFRPILAVDAMVMAVPFDEFTNEQQPIYCEIFEATSRLLYQVYLRQLEQLSH